MVFQKKWNKDVEVSDDEDDTHPNVDTPSLNRWRHESRLLREKELEEEKNELDKRLEFHSRLKSELESRQKRGEPVTTLWRQWSDDEKILEDWKKRVAKKERLMPWNVDTMSSSGFSKTVINHVGHSGTKLTQENNKNQANMTDEERAEGYKKFCKEFGAHAKKFGMLRKVEASKRFLMNNPNLTCQNTINYLILWCIQLTVEEKLDLMVHVVRQAVVLKFLLEWAAELDADPRGCIAPFFNKMGNLEEGVTEFRETVDKEVEILKKHVLQRAEQFVVKEKKIVEEEQEKSVKLGPGGLNPLKVLRSLPPQLRICFEQSNIQLLQQTLQTMRSKEAAEWMQKCVDSGLWVPKVTTTPASDQNGVKQPNQHQKWLAAAIALVALLVSLILPWTWFHMGSSS